MDKITDKKETVENILNYWHTMEFLNQDNIPKWSDSDKRKADKAHEEKKEALLSKNEYDTKIRKERKIRIFCEMGKEKDPYETAMEMARYYGMKRWGDLTVYIGKITREPCIRELAKILREEDDDRPEMNIDRIAWASLQTSANGEYMENTFSFSPVLWAINHLSEQNGEYDDKTVLSKGGYDAVNANYNTELLRIAGEGTAKEGISEEFDEESSGSTEYFTEDGYIRKSAFPIDAGWYKKTIDSIYNNYIMGKIQPTNDKDIEDKCYVSFQLFLDDETIEEYRKWNSEKEFTGLSKTYFLKDIKTVMDKVNQLESGAYLQKWLFDYIYSGYQYRDGYQNDIMERTDLLNPSKENIEILTDFYLEKLDIRKSPLGKWPSGFRPSFMQQTAVNLAIEGYNSKACNKIFSVNGPPGTGKTTLLKEIIANNIVERAKLLAEYSDPDDAFEEMDFQQGNNTLNSYSDEAQHYYRLKNDRINDYGMLVASCNNGAVENITKELPLSSSVSESFLKMGETIEKGKSFNIYFTQYAASLLNRTKPIQKNKDYKEKVKNNSGKDKAKKKEKKVWGLISAPLGKRSNIQTFYRYAMYDLEENNDQKKEFQNRKDTENYRIAKKNFETQLKHVSEIRDKLSAKVECESKIKELEKKETISSNDYRKREELYSKELQSLSPQMEALDAAYREAGTDYERLKGEYFNAEQGMFELQQNIVGLNRDITFLGKLFKTNKTVDAMHLQEMYRMEYRKLENRRAEIERILPEYLNSVREKEMRCSDFHHKVEATQYAFHQEKMKFSNYAAAIKNDIYQENQKIKECEQFLNEALCSEKTGTRLDINFMEELLGEDTEKSTQAHADNPWFTQKYDLEREKLFYYAMKLHEAFITASNSCRQNLIGYFQMLGELKDKNGKRIVYKSDDINAAIQPWLQTLFLLVPVVSTTFASVNSFLKESGPGTIGTLIIDEAGQASPQMAVGALYRSRKAIIVGDPKQIEPVVTEDLDILRDAFRNDIYRAYRRKDFSVQHFADFMNPYGTWLNRGKEDEEWVGCPLVVHRRCISPMFDISNEISYNKMMKQKTDLPSEEKKKLFCMDKSCWINVVGKEAGGKNHFVKEQGEVVIELLNEVFKKNNYPSLFIISPFKTVIKSMESMIEGSSLLSDDWKKKMAGKIGTVHTFQGKEADEVIFLLGCDKEDRAKGAVGWVNANIVNVAVTRAKYRIYVVGDKETWEKSKYVEKLIEKLPVKDGKDFIKTAEAEDI